MATYEVLSEIQALIQETASESTTVGYRCFYLRFIETLHHWLLERSLERPSRKLRFSACSKVS
jgi:hypothetical protein